MSVFGYLVIVYVYLVTSNTISSGYEINLGAVTVKAKNPIIMPFAMSMHTAKSMPVNTIRCLGNMCW